MNPLTWLATQTWLSGLANLLTLFAVAGIVWSAWTMWKSRCRVPWCLRPGEVPVEGTTWRTCCDHAAATHHERLRFVHKRTHGGDAVTYERR